MVCISRQTCNDPMGGQLSRNGVITWPACWSLGYIPSIDDCERCNPGQRMKIEKPGADTRMNEVEKMGEQVDSRECCYVVSICLLEQWTLNLNRLKQRWLDLKHLCLRRDVCSLEAKPIMQV
jgi:hypothetical protein